MNSSDYSAFYSTENEVLIADGAVVKVLKVDEDYVVKHKDKF